MASCSESSQNADSSTSPPAQTAQAPAPQTSERFAELADDFAQLESRYPRRSFYPQDYYDAKLAHAMDTRGERPDDIRVSSPQGTPFGVHPCASLVVNDSDESFELLSGFALKLERDFIASGYSRDVFAEPLLEYERSMLELIRRISLPPSDPDSVSRSNGESESLYAIEDQIREAFVRAAEGRRARLQPDQPTIDTEGGCGAGESPFFVRANPPDGRIWMIRAHSFYRCALRTRTPWNVDSCRWQEANAQIPMQVSGRYFYQARWRNNRSRRGDQNFGFAEEGETDGSGTPVVVITP